MHIKAKTKPDNIQANEIKGCHMHRYVSDPFKLRRLDGMIQSGDFGFPSLDPCSPLQVNNVQPLAFHEALGIYKKIGTLKGYFVHFYIDDKRFLCVNEYPEKYLEMFKTADFLIGPDLSVYRNFPYAVILKNTFDNRVLTKYYQMRGIMTVINVAWSSPQTYDVTFDSLPLHSTIAVNSNCISKRDRKGVSLWLHGYEEAVKRLSPTSVIRYGDKIQGEENIYSEAFYIENPYLNFMRYGR